jgi:hypothetical protein
MWNVTKSSQGALDMDMGCHSKIEMSGKHTYAYCPASYMKLPFGILACVVLGVWMKRRLVLQLINDRD